MSLVVKKAKEQIKEKIILAANAAVAKGQLDENQLTDFVIEVPSNREHGDYAVNAAMVWARTFRKAPRQIAEILTENIDFSDSYIKSCEIAGPGFINFFLNENYYSDIILDVEEKKADYGKSDFGEGKKILVEFVSANPTGPMHIGNARGGALGDCLAAVLETAGYYTEREFYINDAGNQMNKFGLSLDLRYQQLIRIISKCLRIRITVKILLRMLRLSPKFTAIRLSKGMKLREEQRLLNLRCLKILRV